MMEDVRANILSIRSEITARQLVQLSEMVNKHERVKEKSTTLRVKI